jgi:cytochrome bd-type quinol oxidase subunit 2
MARATLGVIVGYVAMAALVMGLFIGMWFVLGVDGVLEKGQFKGNMVLNIGAPAISIAGAILGGWICARVSRSRRTVLVFAAIVFVVGMIAAYSTLRKPEPGPRDPNLTVIEAIKKGREPNWFALLNPFLGVGGILLGGCCVGCCKKKP